MSARQPPRRPAAGQAPPAADQALPDADQALADADQALASAGQAYPAAGQASPTAGQAPPAAGQVADAQQTCAKCGACSTICPVYRQTGREYHTGRGKLHLLERLDPAAASTAYAEILSHCLLCGACSRACSRHIPVAAQLAAARGELTRQAGRQPLLRALGGQALERPRLLRALAPLFQAIHNRRLPADSGLNLRLGLDHNPDPATPALPTPPAATTADHPASPSPPPAATGGHLAADAPYLFNGCYATFLEPEIGRSLNTLLVRQGITPAGPAPDWACCGLAAYSSGRTEAARHLARRNIAAHPGDQPIIVACASCAAHLHRYPELLADDQQWRQPAAQFAARIREFSQFLDQLAPAADPAPPATGPVPAITTGPTSPTSPASMTTKDRPEHEQTTNEAESAPLRVYYHDPCHLRFELQITKEPRRLLSRHRHLELRSAPGGPQCCGHGGLFHLAHPTTSAAILKELCQQANQTEPEVITTACSGCLLHWRQAAAEGRHRARVIHLAVLLARLGNYPAAPHLAAIRSA